MQHYNFTELKYKRTKGLVLYRIKNSVRLIFLNESYSKTEIKFLFISKQ